MFAASSPSGRKVLARVSTTTVGRMLFQLEARHLSMPVSGNAQAALSAESDLQLITPDSVDEDDAHTVQDLPRAKKRTISALTRKATDEEEQKEPLVGAHREG